jgi:site-specific DNA recombinase
MTKEEIMTLVTDLDRLMQALRNADPADKAEIYRRIGLTLTYHPQERRVAAEARPETIMYVGACPRGDSVPCPGATSPKR